jgi:imidazolonepropionase-like amidohydrolase
MLKKLCFLVFTLLFASKLIAQPVPGKLADKPIFIVGATLHLGNGEVINGGVIGLALGKITYVGTGAEIRIDGEKSTIIEAVGKHVYPGFIAPNSILGLSEVESVRATRDYMETGASNANVRALVAYNTDSKVIPTVRSNGILLTQLAPQGGVISGRSSVVQLDAWNWEDAAVSADEGLYVNWPSMRIVDAWWAPSVEEQEKNTGEQLKAIESFFSEAKAYCELSNPALNLKLEALRPVFEGKTRVYVRVSQAKGMVSAVNFFKQYKLKPILVGAEEAGFITDFLKTEGISLLLEQTHRLPAHRGDAVDAPYTLPATLLSAGIPFGLMVDGFWQIRNLPFHAGTLAGYGLTKAQALQTITLNTARILGIDKNYGSLEAGKSATLFISAGDALDMRTCILEAAFIDGRKIDLNNKQKELYKRFSDKYEAEKL